MVANEVKNLSAQTARATEDITRQVSAIQKEVDGALAAIGGIVDVIVRVDTITSTMAVAIGNQTTATREISKNVRSATDETQRVSATIVTVNDAISTTKRSAEDVLAASRSLSDQAEGMRSEVQSFLAVIKDAGERRQYQRLNVSVPAIVYLEGVPLNCAVVDISLGGATFDCQVVRPIGSQVQVQIEGLAQPLKVRIARLTNHLHVQFPLDETTAAIIAEFMTGHEGRGAVPASPQL